MWKRRFWFDTLGGAQGRTFLTSDRPRWCCGSTDRTLSIKRLKPSPRSQYFYYYEGKKIDNEGQENKSSPVVESSLQTQSWPWTLNLGCLPSWVWAGVGQEGCWLQDGSGPLWLLWGHVGGGVLREQLLISVHLIQCVLAIVHCLVIS